MPTIPLIAKDVLIPPNLREELYDPRFPLQISPRIFAKMQETKINGYRKEIVRPSDPEWKFVCDYFHLEKPTASRIREIYCIHSAELTELFETRLASQEIEAAEIEPTWHREPRPEQRAGAMERWNEHVQQFSPFRTNGLNGRERTWEHVKILPLWHGTSPESSELIAKLGFAFRGKIDFNGKRPPDSTDIGYFGSGNYFTNSPLYATDGYSRHWLILSFVSMRTPFPVVGDPTDRADRNILEGRGAFKDYNAHYIPVVPEIALSDCIKYRACRSKEKPFCDEVVVFDKSQVLPRFLIRLETKRNHKTYLSTKPVHIHELKVHLYKIFQNPLVARDHHLCTLLQQEYTDLLLQQEDAKSLPNPDPDFVPQIRLSERQEHLSTHARAILTTSGIDAAARKALMGWAHLNPIDTSGPLYAIRTRAPGDPDRQKALHEAARRGHLATLRTLEFEKVDLFKPNSEGATIVHSAAAEGQIPCLRFLLRRRANLSQPDNSRKTPAHYAAQNGQVACLEFLEAQGVNLMALDHDGYPPAYYASQNNQVDCIKKFFVAKGVLSKPNRDGQTAADLAAASEQTDWLDILKAYEIDFSKPDISDVLVFFDTDETPSFNSRLRARCPSISLRNIALVSLAAATTVLAIRKWRYRHSTATITNTLAIGELCYRDPSEAITRVTTAALALQEFCCPKLTDEPNRLCMAVNRFHLP